MKKSSISVIRAWLFAIALLPASWAAQAAQPGEAAPSIENLEKQLESKKAAKGAEAPKAAERSSAAPNDPRARIAQKFPGVKVDDIQPSQISGMYAVTLGADTAYVSADGKYLISGDLYDVDSRINLTELGRSTSRAKALAKLDEREMIVFASATVEPKHTITVFTDVECGYCRKLHGEIEQLNKLGIRVRYMAYPRAGPGSEDWRKMESVWCAKDRKSAITDAKLGKDVKSASCGATPVAKQYQLGEDMGVNGTPAIFTASGGYIGGYLPPAQMLAQLEELKQAEQAKK
jgi:thiol:disulfide interchange protein DsbC